MYTKLFTVIHNITRSKLKQHVTGKGSGNKLPSSQLARSRWKTTQYSIPTKHSFGSCSLYPHNIFKTVESEIIEKRLIEQIMFYIFFFGYPLNKLVYKQWTIQGIRTPLAYFLKVIPYWIYPFKPLHFKENERIHEIYA